MLPLEIVKNSFSQKQKEERARELLHLVGLNDAFTREDLWQIMRDLRQQQSFTTMLITHDLRESVFLADQVVVLSGRPASTQYILDVDLPSDRNIDQIYTPEAVGMLATLREQIEIAQGRRDLKEVTQ